MIELITGSMFSGKSTLLFEKLERAVYAEKKILLIRPIRDNRGYFSHSNIDLSLKKLYDDGKFTKYEVANFDNKEELSHIVNMFDCIFIDEFFMIGNCKNIIDVLPENVDLYFAGLIATSENKLFDEAISILPYCDKITKKNGICTRCHSEYGGYSMYVGNLKKDSDIVVGDGDRYECVCRNCYKKEKGIL